MAQRLVYTAQLNQILNKRAASTLTSAKSQHHLVLHKAMMKQKSVGNFANQLLVLVCNLNKQFKLLLELARKDSQAGNILDKCALINILYKKKLQFAARRKRTGYY